MKCLVTGCAGFIGSTLTDQLLADGNDVIGIDSVTDYYARSIKMKNIAGALQNPRFQFLQNDILSLTSFPEVDVVYHLAAQAGVRDSWGQDFPGYSRNNIDATQHLLEFYKDRNLKKFVYASSSSVYGDVPLPMKEDMRLQPVSPYGVTKIAAEYLCYAYWKNFRLPTLSLRYFTVYGPRQRPDMAFHKFVTAILNRKPVTIYGDGNQTRDFTYISDVIDSNIKAACSPVKGKSINIGGGSRISVNGMIRVIEEECGWEASTIYDNQQKGDVSDTLADNSMARELLGWVPRVSITAGVGSFVEWYRQNNEKK